MLHDVAVLRPGSECFAVVARSCRGCFAVMLRPSRECFTVMLHSNRECFTVLFRPCRECFTVMLSRSTAIRRLFAMVTYAKFNPIVALTLPARLPTSPPNDLSALMTVAADEG